MDRKEKVKEVLKILENGVQNMFDSEQYKSYLRTLSKFHTYSAFNSMLIYLQCPGASFVAGYKTWETKFGRYVKSGEKAIQILAPLIYKKKTEDQEDTDECLLHGFRVVNVFDVSQTDGAALDLGSTELTGCVNNYSKLIQNLKDVSPVPVNYEELNKAYGLFSPSSNSITLAQGLSELQTIKTCIHEIAHAYLFNTYKEEETSKCRSVREVEAESVAYAVCSLLGLDTSEYSFFYIAGWSASQTTVELQMVLKEVHDTVNWFVEALETNQSKLVSVGG